jgi:hypothetical protein
MGDVGPSQAVVQAPNYPVVATKEQLQHNKQPMARSKHKSHHLHISRSQLAEAIGAPGVAELNVE